MMTGPMHTRWIDFPDYYKFVGIDVRLDVDLTMVERSVYSILEYLGDLGGLFDALHRILGALVAPLVAF